MSTLTAERLREVLHYDPATGVWTWLKSYRDIWTGMTAGCVRPDGYRKIGVDLRQYRSDRLAVLYMTGTWPVKGVDHKNVVSDDDRWENLRPANQSQNGANRKRGRHNTSGFKGVSWVARRHRWRAQIMVRREQIFLGHFNTPEDAHAAYAAAAKKHFGEFARAA